MALDRIQLTNFRNHRESRIDGTTKFNLLFGDNGAGKTNVLEALSLLAPGRGLRRAALAELPLQGGDGGFALSADLIQEGEPVRLSTGISSDRPARRIVHVNGADAPASRLAEWLSIGWLTPAMDRLFTDGAGARRRFLDRLVLAAHPAHARNATRLENAIRERNRLLSEPVPSEDAWLDAVEVQIAEAGAEVSAARANMIERLHCALAELPEAPFARPELAYQAGGPIEQDTLAAALAKSRSEDRAAQRTLTGPHRDELIVTMSGKGQPASECSTGEQKAMLIAIMLAHSYLLQGPMAGEARPRILLLDEVAAHLDPVRREALFDRLRAGSAQVWLTGTELAPFETIQSEAAVWQVVEGALKRLA